MSVEALLKYCTLLRPVWTLTYQDCTCPTMFATAHPPSKEDVYYNNDIASKCLKEIGGQDLKMVYDYIKTEKSKMANVVYYCRNMGYTHRIYSPESQSLGYLLSLLRHQRRCQFVSGYLGSGDRKNSAGNAAHHTK